MAMTIPEVAMNNRLAKIGVSAYISTPVENATLSTTYVRMNGIFTNDILEGFIINDDDKLEYAPEDGEARTFKLDWSAVFKTDTARDIIYIAVFKGEVLDESTEDYTRARESDEPYTLSANGSIYLEPGDTIEIRIKQDAGTSDVITLKFSTTLIKMF